MLKSTTRRHFLKSSAVSLAGLSAMAGRSWGQATQHANEKLGIAVIGVAGQGQYSIDNLADQAIVALCDVDENRATAARKQFPKARFYADFRQMLDTQHKDIDAVVVATPDHTHAPATLAALRAGKHVYCEKPLTHTVQEARLVAQATAKSKLATQMGTQLHASANYRRIVELVQSGAIGPVHEAMVWCPSVWAGGDRPKDTPPVPEGLHWDLWIGPAPMRPYHPDYVPQKWRGYWDFGGGGLGDMACHTLDLIHWAIDLRYPKTIEAKGPEVHPEHAPDKINIQWEHPARQGKPPVKVYWFGGQNRPDHPIAQKIPNWGYAMLFIGEKGMIIADYERHQLLPEKDFADFKRPDPFIPDSPGHHKEWVQACKTGGKTSCHFDYAGALTETVLLGNVAYRSGRRIEWDAEKMNIRNAPEAMKFIQKDYRNNWKLS